MYIQQPWKNAPRVARGNHVCVPLWHLDSCYVLVLAISMYVLTPAITADLEPVSVGNNICLIQVLHVGNVVHYAVIPSNLSW